MSRIAFVNIHVSDLDRAAAFYRDQLGFEELTRLTTPMGIDEVILRCDATGAGLVLLLDPARTEPLEHGNAYSRIVIETDKIGPLFERLATAGTPIVEPPTPRDHFPITVGYLRDPDGYLIEVYELAEVTA